MQHPKQSIISKRLFGSGVKMTNLPLNKFKLIAKNRGFKDYENKSKDDLIKILGEPKTKISLSKKRIKKIREKFNELRDEFSELKVREIRRNLFEIKNKKNSSTSKTKEIEKIFLN